MKQKFGVTIEICIAVVMIAANIYGVSNFTLLGLLWRIPAVIVGYEIGYLIVVTVPVIVLFYSYYIYIYFFNRPRHTEVMSSLKEKRLLKPIHHTPGLQWFETWHERKRS